MIEIMLIFSAQYRKIVTSFEFRECYGSDEQSRKLIYERTPHVICFCNYQMLVFEYVSVLTLCRI